MDSLEDRYDFQAARERMVEKDLARRGIDDPRVLEVFRTLPRHRFVDPGCWDEAYADHPVRIDCGQTISQPYIVALMTQLLRVEPDMSVLEVGTGSGYQTAVLAALGARVWTIERHEGLTDRAVAVLEELGLDDQVDFLVGDGSLGEPEFAPYDRIIVTAAAPEPPPALEAQLSTDGGRMVLPAGRENQRLVAVTRRGDERIVEEDIPVRFVPLLGEQGF